MQFPNNYEEINLLKFLGQYQYLSVNDTKYFFKSNKYYRKRISNLINKKLITRKNLKLTLADSGKQYLKSIGATCNKINRNEKYIQRLLIISNLAAFYFSIDTVKFIASYNLKNKEVYTNFSRKYYGLINISGINYLVYYISKDSSNKYISSVIYDISKEKTYKNFIIFTDNISKINTLDFSFGFNQVLIIENTNENKERLKYINSINWFKVVNTYFKSPFLSEYNFCDYIDLKHNFISYFYMYDTEKVNRINQFIRENNPSNVNIICDIKLYQLLTAKIQGAKIIPINLENYINKERTIYE